MQFMSAGQITDHDYHVILNPDFFLYSRSVHRSSGWYWPQRRDSQHLWELDWLHLLSATPTSLANPIIAASSTSSFSQWHHHLGHLCGSRLSALLRRGLLGSILDRESLDHCQGCQLGKQIQLPYHSSESVS
jgi:hypothetical protein